MKLLFVVIIIFIGILVNCFNEIRIDKTKRGQCFKHNYKEYDDLVGIKRITSVYSYSYGYCVMKKGKCMGNFTMRKKYFLKNHTLTKCSDYGIIDNKKSEMRLRTALLSSKCPPIKMINNSTEAWVAHDYKTRRYAKRRCKSLYGETNKCLKLFIKSGIKSYQALCGGLS